MSATMAEAFDAQMSDSGDIDVSMYPGGIATVDSWLSAEASMGDVAFSTDTATFGYAQEGIEIDMMDDDEAITEYEMADDDEAYHGHELEDIEVLDDSRAASPPIVDHSSLTVLDSAEHLEPMQLPPSDHGAPPSPDTCHPIDHASSASPVVYPGATQIGPHKEDSAAADTLHHPPALIEENTLSTSPLTPPIPHPHGSTEGGNAPAGPLVSSALEHAEEVAASSENVGTVESHSLFEPHLTDAEGFHGHNTVKYTTVPSGDKTDFNSTEDLAGDLAADAGDPHEISDGVYIDPPPPVLLTLPPSAEYAVCCLFNQPRKGSGPNASEGAECGPPDVHHLLLHDRPTLYYEPLSSVFDALRHEDCVQNLPGYAEAELVLEAYEIQLAISEDNVYAHEVTLHELDVIHDGSDLHGPLRLKLKLVTPRFVTRYHLLRDQISRLNLTADGDESRSGAAMSNPPDVDGIPAVAEVCHTEETIPVVDNEPLDEVDGNVYSAIGANLHDPVDDDSRQSDLALESALEQHDEDCATGLEPNDEVAETLSNDLNHEEDAHDEDHLGASEVHADASVDTGEVGGYLEHDEFADDEDEFRGTLPEDFGDQTDSLAYHHTSAAADRCDDLANVEDGVVDEHEASPGGAAYDVVDLSSAEGGEALDPQLHDDGVNTSGPTDSSTHLISVNDHVEQDNGQENAGRSDKHGTLSGHSADDEPTHDLEADNFAHEESATLSSEDEDGLDDWGDEDDENNNYAPAAEPTAEMGLVDTLSRKSSSNTLASKTSKRTYDEVELDDFDDDPSLLEPGSSPDTKRPRVQ
ncbi:hypothetical protein BC628DRAFT_1352403 [Trametes gibbosa]|nr:hypothetical protein BC628DRAFT_1352403 [Trametes gibbosa]